MPKKTTLQPNTPEEKNIGQREIKILNVLCNTSLLLMAAMTEAFSEMFTDLSKEMVTALTASLGTAENSVKDSTRNIDVLQKKLPQHLRKELITMKKEFTTQLKEKRDEIGLLLADPRFDRGITIVERTPLNLPKLTQDLDERSLLGYLALLQASDPRFTTMIQELFEWMKTLPQPEIKK
ncbi:MAG TPA: hypothetical protein DSN98_03365 [Thermoplasmata archaeon]|nr:MAG TPA: hypothetical protein DSN98_03365 [Thermoplasmata archaeon]